MKKYIKTEKRESFLYDIFEKDFNILCENYTNLSNIDIEFNEVKGYYFVINYATIDGEFNEKYIVNINNNGGKNRIFSNLEWALDYLDEEANLFSRSFYR